VGSLLGGAVSGEGRERGQEGQLGAKRRTNNMLCARCRAALVFRLPRVMSFSAMRWASFALGQVVRIDSFSIRDVTRLRRRAMRWEDLRPRWRCFIEDIAVRWGWNESDRDLN
jgi:hypothetical protein